MQLGTEAPAPREVERTVEDQIEVVRRGRVVAFLVDPSGRAGISIAAELVDGAERLVRADVVCRAIEAAILEEHARAPSVVLLLRPGTLPMAGDGALDRSACEGAWRSGSLGAFAVYRNGALERRASGGERAAERDAGCEGNGRAKEGLETEHQVRAIFREVLNASVQDDETFFAFGGNSLSAAQLLARASEVFGVQVPLESLFSAPSPRAFAAEIGRLRREPDRTGPVPPLVRAPGDAGLPLSSGEQRLWFLWQLEPESAAYNVAGAARFRGELDLVLVRRAFEALGLRHESLRTTYRDQEGVTARVIREAARLEIPLVDLTASGDSSEERARAIAGEEASRPFDLEQGPLVRVVVIRLGAREHLLVVSMHHIICDGRSMNVLVREFVECYRAFARGAEPELPELPIRYGDYAIWQKQVARHHDLQRQLEYWKRHLGSEHPVLSLPADRPRPAVQSSLGGRVQFEIDAALTARVKELARERHTTPFTVFFAVWNVLLGRYSGQTKVRVGVPVANRNRVELEGVIGFFVNTQVLQTEVSGELSFESLLDRVRAEWLTAQAHGDLPFDELVEALNPERSLSHNPLFQVMYNHLPDDTVGVGALDALRLEGLERIQPSTQFDLMLDTSEAEEGIRATLTYSLDLFERVRIERMARHFRLLLAACLTDPARPVGRIALLDEQERAELAAWNDTARAYGEERLIHELIDAQAQETPDSPAVVYEGVSLGYRELVERADRLARSLRALGVGPDVLVGVCAERSLELVIALLGVVKAGGAYLPLDPEYPAERLEYMLAEARPRVVLAEERLLSALPRSGAIVRSLEQELAQPDGECSAVDGASVADVERRVHAKNLVYCIYTSGSTGAPKGVVNTHAGLQNRLLWMQETYRLTAADRVLQKTPFSFDVSVWEFFWPLLSGATLVVAPPGAHKDPAELRAVIEREQVTVLHFVPSMLQAFASSGNLEPCRSLRQVICSGEALHEELANEVLQRHPARLSNLYGPTEASIDVTAWECVPEPERAAIPIGRPIANTAIYLLDGELLPVPFGAVGELYIAGVGLARGYIQRPELTAERFIPSPFHGGERLYRSGDLARYRADGAIEYVGRADHQVKIRGFRVELGEIEAQLLRQPSVREAALLAREDVPGQKRLVAYVVPSPRGGAGSEAPEAEEHRTLQQELRAALAAALPEYMVPNQYVFLSALPVTKNGKLDRAALPAPDPAQQRPAYAAPATELETALASIWCDVLRAPEVGVHDNFFELGGDSILALQVVGKARSRGIGITPKDLFRHQTLEALARAARMLSTLAFDEPPAQGAVELTPIQCWWTEQTPEDPHHWNQALLFEAAGPLERDALEGALAALVEHHDALRLRFHKEEGRWQQRHGEGVAPVVWYIDVGAEVDPEAAVERAANAAQRSLDLENGPVLRAVHVTPGNGRGERLLLVIHHLVVDGVSWRILLEDLCAAYGQRRAGEPVRLQQKTSSFQSWSRALGAYATSASLAEELAYWQRVVGEAPSVSREDEGRSPDAPTVTRTVRVELEAPLTGLLLTSARKAYRMEVDELLLAALARTLSRERGPDGVLIELEGHGREDLFAELDVSRTVGWFTTRYPVRFPQLPAGAAEALKAVKERLRAIPNRGIGYGLLRYGSSHTGELARGERPVLTFNYLGQLDAWFEGNGLLRLVEGPSGDARSPARMPVGLEVNASVRGGVLALDWQFDPRSHTQQNVRELADAFVAELSVVIRHCAGEGNAGVTPSDFLLAGLCQAELDALPVDPRNIEDIFPLSPLQQGLLLHTLLEPESGIYLMQDQYRFESTLLPEAFTAAWERVIERHPMLRASFVWQFEGRMLQVIQRSVRGAVEYLDLQHLRSEAQERAIRRLLEDELRRGFALDRTPLVRMRLIRLGASRFHFVQSYHHALLDAWCRSLLLVEFFEHYRAALRGARAELPAPPSYRDFIVWLTRQDAAATHRYWRELLAGFEAATPLGIQRPGNTPGAVVLDAFAELSEAQTRELVRVAQSRKLTVNTFTQGAWAALLAQYSGSSDVVFGVTVAGRPAELPGVQETVGLFINTIPLRVRLPRVSVSRWLQTLLEQNVAMREHEHLPLVEIQSSSDVPRGQPLFHSLFVFENAPLDASLVDRQEEFRVELSHARTHTNYPLTVVVVPGQRLKLQISYDAAQFEERDIARLLEHFQRLLLAMVEQVDGGVFELPTLGRDEARRLAAWNRTERGQPFEKSYIGLFEEQVALHPHRVAATCRGRAWTLSELDVRASQIGAALRREGVRPGALVGVSAERGFELLTSILGIFKVGAAYLPLDIHSPAARSARVLGLGGVAVVLVDEHTRAALERALELVPPDERPRALPLAGVPHDGSSPATASVRVPPDALAYVIFTSGSTGVPKGAMVTSRGMLNNQLSKVPYLGLGEGDVIAQTASQSFDISVWQMLTGLLCGARVEIVPDAVAQDPAALVEYVEACGITILESVPSLIRAMLEQAPGRLARLRFLLPTGEALPPPLVDDWFRRYPHVPLINAYGPAECADDVALHRIQEALPAGATYVPIGHPTDNHRLYVLDPLLRHVPTGIVGELYVAGAGVGHGYFRDPARTAEAFVPNPYSEHAGERLYRTGDRARRREDGALEYTGRSDHQVKVRGVRIELGEIEARLRAHPGVHEALVLAREDEPGQKRLVAYVVPEDGLAPARGNELRDRIVAWLRAGLPDSMVPLAYVFLDQFPLSANGKVDRRALPAPEGTRDGRDYVPPSDDLERSIATIWEAVLAVPRVGRNDDFFELGGHSLLATQVASRVRRQLDLELPLRALFDASRLCDFAARVEQARADRSKGGPPPIERADRTRRIPLSYAQQRLWFLWQMERASSVHNLTETARWRGSFDREALRRAFDTIVQRHEVLRTKFREENGEPYQVIEPARGLRIEVVDARSCPEAEREALALELAEREAGEPFDLEHDPLLRLKIVEFAGDDRVVLVTAHHIVSDGWSMHLMVDEFAELYAAFTLGRAPRLPELVVQYADYAVWQRQWLDSGELDRQLAYFRAALGTEHPVLALPADRPRPAAQSYRGATHQFEIDAALTGALRELGRRNEVTLFTVCLAALQVLLARYSGQTDVRVGVPVASRGRLEIESLIGFFVNTHVFRTDVAGDPSFEALLDRVKEVTLGAQTNQELPFERLVEALKPARSLAHNPLFQVLYNHVRPEHRALEELSGVSIRWLARRVHATEVDLTINAVESGDGMSVSMIYATDLFDAETIERLARHWRHLLSAVVENPRERIGRLPLFDATERRALIETFNATASDYPETYCVHELIERQAARTPDRVAATFLDETLSYRDLNTRANRLASTLQKLGVGPEVRVGIYLARSTSMLVGVLAVLKAGGAYVPLDPEYPAERIAYMLEDAAPKVVLTEARLLPRLPESRALAWCLEREAPASEAESETNPPARARPESLAYCIYTSGSTGAPKGVAVSHRALVNCLWSMLERPGLGADDRMLGLTSLSFDIAALELFLPLVCGARVVLVDRETAADARALLSQIERHGITVVQATPVTWRMLSEAPGFERLRLEKLLSGGEALPQDLARRLLERTRARDGGRSEVWNVYGPTETTIWSARHALDERAEPLLGYPIENTEIHVLDSALSPVPPGVIGEVYIGGHGLARGYWNRPELTAERYVPDPFTESGGQRLYRTGDLARRRRDGALEYVGRVDHQVKLRGHRIELGEIEARLLEREDVRAAAVIVREDVAGDPRLVAYVVPQQEGLVSAGEDEQAAYREELLGRLRAVLPQYMLPSACVLLPSLPLTKNRKVDRKALPAPVRGEPAARHVAPRNELERRVAAIWREVLGVERVGVHDDFFDLGGHSLLATQVLSRIRQQLDVELGLRVLFEAPDLERFAARVQRARDEEERTAGPPLAPVARRERMPLSPAQERLWFLWRLEPESAAYNVGLAVRLSGALDRSALAQSCARLVQRHEALRTAFRDDDGRPYAVIGEAQSMPVREQDLSAYPDAERSARLQTLLDDEAGAPFDLAAGSLLRIRLVRLSAAEHVLVLTMHHIVSDGWSLNVLVEELAHAYAARCQGQEPDFVALPVQFADYAVWQRAWLQAGALERQLAYWKAELGSEHPVLALPTDRPRPAVQSFRGATHHFELPAALTHAVRELGRSRNVTSFMVLLAAFKLLLHRYTGQAEIRVGVPNASRGRAELERIVGVFVNLHVLRTEIDPSASFEQLLERVKQVALGAQAHPDLPFEELVHALNPARSLSHNPLVQVMYNHQTPRSASLRKQLGQLGIEEVDAVGRSTQFDLTLTTTDDGERLRAALTYGTDLFDAATIERLARQFTHLLAAAASEPGRASGQLPLLDDDERRELVEAWNETERDYPADRFLPELFEEQVRRSPHAIALVFAREKVTYAELNAAANRLARRLRERGVGPDVLVAIYMDRSPSLLVALLAVLKAGGAYLPLDPDYPAERLAYMLRDARPGLVLTETRLAGRLPETPAPTWCVDRDGAELERESVENLPAWGHPEHLAYCLYTSGSTGTPKAVAIPRRALVNFLWSMRERPGIASDDRVLSLTSLSFDIAGLELYLPLLVGARVVLVDRSTASDAEALLDQLDQHGVTVAQATPATWRMLSQHPRFSQKRDLRVFCGGEALDAGLGSRLLERTREVWNLYGPTETTIWSTLERVDGARPEPRLGRPIANTQVYVLDAQMSPTPIGVPGELYIGGAGLARGYLGRPEWTADRFVPDPFGGDGARLYRTGDRARYQPDGAVEYLGRADHQLKIRGYRVELGEIEARLRGLEGVRQAAVVARRDDASELQLVAHVVTEPGLLGAASAEDQVAARRALRGALAAVLPEYMVPNRYRFLNALPLTSSGKIDRRALAAQAPDDLEARHLPPRTELEQRLAAIWQAVLGVPRIGLGQDFFELGGHSLLAAQVISRIQKELGVSLPLRKLLEATTIERLAEQVSLAERTRPSSEALQRLDAIMTELEESQWT